MGSCIFKQLPNVSTVNFQTAYTATHVRLHGAKGTDSG